MPDASMRDTLNAVFEQRMSDLGNQVATGDISVQDFQIAMRQELRDAHALQLIAAADGEPSQDDFLKLGSQLQKQYRYLEDFAHQITDGTQAPGGIANRASLYAGSGKATYWRQAMGTDLPAYPGDGQTPCYGKCNCSWRDNGDGSFTWELGEGEDGSGDHCDPCIANSEQYNPYWPEGTQEGKAVKRDPVMA